MELSTKFILFSLLCAGAAIAAHRLQYFLLLAVVAITYFYFIFRWARKFSKIGITSADGSVSKGLDYVTSLLLVTQRFDFMGTGASKLTSTEEFEHALARCNHSQTPIRLLLAKPNSPLLKEAAKQFDTSPDDYAHRVMQSLRKLAEYKVRRSFNIEVRYHKDGPESFRLMFIDDAICLTSVNVYGKGDGSDYPQLIFSNSKKAGVDAGFYMSIKQYFESCWQNGEVWDPYSILASDGDL